MVWLLLLAALALSGATEDPDLVCYRTGSQRNFTCRWRAMSGNATYVLRFCYHSPHPCKEFKTGSANHFRFPYHTLRVLLNLTAWVESHTGGRVERTQNITLQLENAIKLDPPPPQRITFSKSRGILLLTQLDERTGRDEPLQREARYRRMKGTEWTQVECQTQGEHKGNNLTVICNLETAAACEVQLRHKTPHWSSYWSDWSGSIFVPAEIPEVNYTVGRLGRNGQRNVTFCWQTAREEQWKVRYRLAVYMPACGCTKLKKEVPEREETTLTLALSGAEYHVSLSASNPAGSGPEQTYRIPPDPGTEMSFLNVSSAGSSVRVEWAAKTNGTFYCLEKHPLGEPQENQGECIHKQFLERGSYVDTGTVKPGKCYRIAVHGGGPEKHWTFGSTYHFATNTSFAGPIYIQNITANSAVLLWKPSPLSQCPGMLKKYIICHTSEQDNGTAYHEANSSAVHYSLRGLQPGTAYWVGIQAAAADRDESCSPQHPFKTMKLGPNPAEWKLKLRYLSIFLGVPLLAVFYHVSKKRAQKVLFPPLPSPMDCEAIKFPTEEMSQVKPRPGFVEPSEEVSPTQPLVTEFTSDKGEPEVNPETRSLHLYPVTEETAEMLQAKEGQAGSENDLPFEYRRQVLLTPAEEEQEDDFREVAGVCGQNNFAEAGPGPSQPRPDEGGGMEPTGLSRPLVQLSLLLSDKPVIIKNGGSFDL